MTVRLLGVLLACMAALMMGCGDGDGDEHDGHDHDGHVHDGDSDGSADPLADMSAEERELVKAQKVCPVSGEELGSMGTPIKETWKGQTVYFCCKACRKPFLKDPAKYIAKLEKAPR